MKQMRLYIILIVIFLSCQRVKVPPDTPKCVKQKIIQYQKERVIAGYKMEGPLSVYEIELNGETLYWFYCNPEITNCFIPPCPDAYYVECVNLFFDKDCNRVHINNCDCQDKFCIDSELKNKIKRKIWSVE